MRRNALALVPALVLLSTLACTISIPRIQGPSIRPTFEVGEMQEYEERVSSAGVEQARVEIILGVGEITLTAGDPDSLFYGQFRTNVAEWAPEVAWQNGVLRIEQGPFDSGIGEIGVAEPGAKNEWELEFSPEIPLEMELDMGASEGDLDLGGLALTDLSLEAGASDLVVHFDEPNTVQMDNLVIQAGAADLRLNGIGNAGPREVTVEGGVGRLVLDFSGDWRGSARVEVEAGAGDVTLRLPEDTGVWVGVEEMLGSVDADDGLTRSGGAYVNDAYGEAEVELFIEVSVGVGSIELESVSE